MWDNSGLVTAMEKVDRLFPASQLVDLSEPQPCGPIAAKRVLESTYIHWFHMVMSCMSYQLQHIATPHTGGQDQAY